MLYYIILRIIMVVVVVVVVVFGRLSSSSIIGLRGPVCSAHTHGKDKTRMMMTHSQESVKSSSHVKSTTLLVLTLSFTIPDWSRSDR
jgi:hypothetical protein